VGLARLVVCGEKTYLPRELPLVATTSERECPLPLGHLLRSPSELLVGRVMVNRRNGRSAPFLAALLVACSSHGSTASVDASEASAEGGSTQSHRVISGTVQKGPFILGTSVTLQELDDQLNPTGITFDVTTNDQEGDFAIPANLTSRYAEVIANGYYFDELSAQLSESQLTLRAIVDLTSESTVDVNLVTSMSEPLVRTLFGQGASFASATSQAEASILAAVGFRPPAGATFSEVSLTGSDAASATLLAASLVVAEYARSRGGSPVAELSQLLAEIGATVASDASDSPLSGLTGQLCALAAVVDVASVRADLTQYYAGLGVSVNLAAFEPLIASLAAGCIDAGADVEAELGTASFAFVVNGVAQTPLSCAYADWEFADPFSPDAGGPNGPYPSGPALAGSTVYLSNTGIVPLSYTAQPFWNVSNGGYVPGVATGDSGQLVGVLGALQRVDITAAYNGGIVALLGSPAGFSRGALANDEGVIAWPTGLRLFPAAPQMSVVEIEVTGSCRQPDWASRPSLVASTLGASSSSSDASGPSTGDAAGPGTDNCSAACAAMAGCPPQSCYAVSASPVPPSMFDGIADSKLQPQYAVDGNLATRYATGQLEASNEWFQVDLCENVQVDGLELNDSDDPSDAAAAYSVQVSLDGADWTTVATSATPAAVDLVLSFRPVLARFVRFNQTGTSANWWAIDELKISCAPTDASAAGGE
jgi:hypothetical protein